MMTGTNKKLNLAAYTFMHFVVDLSCIFFLMGMIYVRMPSGEMCVRAAVIYNMFAFALPALLGFAADITGKNAFVSLAGCLMILINYILVPDVWTSVALIGIGNGLFHIGGGRQVMRDSSGRFSSTGIFVSSGALGVYLGKNMSGNFRGSYISLMCVLLALSVMTLFYLSVSQRKIKDRSDVKKQKVTLKLILVSVLLFFVVIIRSYYSSAAVYPWNNTFITGLIFTLCVAAGKFTGGIAADKIGVMKTSVISLALAGILSLFAPASSPAGCLSILLFNMTMPLTLSLLYKQWKELPGFAFGLLMLALFFGTLPSMLWKIRWFSSAAGNLFLCIISLILLLGAVLLSGEEKAEKVWKGM